MLPDALVAPAAALGDEPSPTDAYGRAMRHDGWTPARQRRFLECIADGHIVEHAARMVGLSVTSAYAFRRRPAGAAFALGWRAANLVARDHLADTMLDRARHGTTEVITRADGSTVERHRINDRLGLQLLARLDRQADAAQAGAAGDAAAARLVAGDFDAFCDLVAAEAGAARAALFLAARSDAAADLADLAALARADRARRAAPDGEAADLDPAARHDWTAGQWLRAEAAGIVALAPPPGAAPQLPQLVPDDAPPAWVATPVWWCPAAQDYRTHFPPPDDFDGEEEGDWNDHDYQRTLTDAERRMIGAAPFDPDRPRREAADARDSWFAARAAQPAADPSPSAAPNAPRDPAPQAPPPAERLARSAPPAPRNPEPPRRQATAARPPRRPRRPRAAVTDAAPGTPPPPAR